MSEVRVRFAPSPTGYLHVGGLRTALYNYLFAAHHHGKVILRIEDTDQSRKVEGAVENLIESLEWAKIPFDEGPSQGGDYGPYYQSERLELYQKQAKQLVENGNAYPCFCSSEALDQMREEQTKKKLPIRYDGRCAKLPLEEVQQRVKSGETHVVRMKVDHSREDYLIQDLIRGEVRFPASQIDEQIIIKSDGFPTYHLANVVDDHEMKISHVIRGEEWLSSTPKHIQLYEYFGWEKPEFAHLPLLLNADRSKLSKRQGDVATEDYKKKGFLPESLGNFIALLSWTPKSGEDQEIFSFQEMVELFDLAKVSKAGAVFDQAKLQWVNQQYFKQKTDDELLGLLADFLPEYTQKTPREQLLKMVSTVRESLVTLGEIGTKLDLFYKEDLEITDPALLEIISTEDAQKVYQNFLEQLDGCDDFNGSLFPKVMKKVQKATGVKGKNLWGPMRIAITLVEHGPDLAKVIDVFGKEKCRQMVEKVLKND